MKNLEQSIIKVLKESMGIYESHEEVSKKLNSAAGDDVGGEKANFTDGSGPNKYHPSGEPSHSSPVKHHYYHQGDFDGGGYDDHQKEHHITVSHHDDGTATVQHSVVHRKWNAREGDYRESVKHKEKHLKDLNSAIDHVKKLDTN